MHFCCSGSKLNAQNLPWFVLAWKTNTKDLFHGVINVYKKSKQAEKLWAVASPKAEQDNTITFGFTFDFAPWLVKINRKKNKYKVFVMNIFHWLGEQQKPNYTSYSRGLVAVMLYWDGKRNLASALRTLIQCRKGKSWTLELLYVIDAVNLSHFCLIIFPCIQRSKQDFRLHKLCVKLLGKGI